LAHIGLKNCIFKRKLLFVGVVIIKVFVEKLQGQAGMMKDAAINFKFKNEVAMMFSFFLFLGAFNSFVLLAYFL